MMAQYSTPRWVTTNTSFANCRSEALQKLRMFADEWSQGNPEEPQTEQALEELISIIDKWKFLKHPYNP